MGNAKLSVVFLTGSGHTGTTLLALFMDAHPQIASVGEVTPTRKRQARGAEAINTMRCSCTRRYLECPFWGAVYQRMQDRDGRGDYGRSHDYRYQQSLVHKLLTRPSHRPTVQAIQWVASRALPAHRARLEQVDRESVFFIESVLQETGADVFFDTTKSPTRLGRLLALDRLEVRVVRITRDVRGFAGSAKRRGHKVSDAALAWRNRQQIVAGIVDRLPRDRVFNLRYEDLCEGPRDWQRQLYAFGGVELIEPPTTVKPRDHHVLGNAIRLQDSLSIRRPDRWQDRLTPSEIGEVMTIAGGLNAELGYEC